MSTTAGTRVPGGQAQPAAPGGTKEAGGLSLVAATALVIGSIIGTGVFTMPAVMAAGGTSSLAVLAVVGVGAMLLAVLFGQLTRRVPDAAGGLYAYARHEYGDFAGFTTAWSYWISSWVGNAAIVASWVFYVNVLFGWGHPSGWADWGIALVALWVPACCSRCGSPSLPATRPSTRPWSSCCSASSSTPCSTATANAPGRSPSRPTTRPTTARSRQQPPARPERAR
jgi:Amino acid permease